MKRNWPYYVAAFALAVIGVVVLRHYGQLFPSGEVSEVYRRYSVRDDLQVEFFKDFRIDDTLVVDVTVLQATTDSAWNLIEREFIALPKESICEIDTTLPITKITHLQPYDDSCVVSAIYAQKTVYIFSSDKKEIFGNILFKIFDVSTKQRPKTNKLI